MDHQTVGAWRLITSNSMPAAENMALDEALLAAFDPDTSAPVLRLYGWEPPALSLGRFQRAADVLDLARCRAAGVPFVRRITGGGVIYHADELTYSIVCAPHQIPATASIKDSFRVLTTFLLEFYHSLGLDAGYAVDRAGTAERLGERTPFCFAGRETFDILVNGRKIGGNAQRRLKRVIFQHGSIPLCDRVSTGIDFLRERPVGIGGEVTSLADAGVTFPPEGLRQRLAAAFAACHTVELHPGVPSDRESALAQQLLKGKYQGDHWNLEGAGE